MLYSLKELLDTARENRFAVPAFNISSLDMLHSVLRAADRMKAPVILEIHPDELAFIGDEFINTVRALGTGAEAPVGIHLDHGGSYEDTVRAVRDGFTSVMIDGSQKSYEENVAVTQKVVEMAHAVHVSVEAELGTIGRTGLNYQEGITGVSYTDPKMAADFVERTKIDALAVAIGTAHGLYPKGFVPKLNISVLKEIRAVVDIPLVLHGGSSNPDAEIQQAVENGICKVNISSDMKNAYYSAMREYLAKNPLAYEPNVIGPVCMEAAEKVILHKFELMKNVNTAKYYS